jgi:hypothetical protein
LATALPLAGCGTWENAFTIYRTTHLDSGVSPITDAKQRVVVNVPASGHVGQNKPKRIICAEPSPDVAQVLSTAIDAAIRADVQGRGSGSGRLSASAAASIAQLGERFASIQLLRDGLYRACEAYANGAIRDTTYALLLSRIDDVMVTLLSGEMAAGAFGRNLAAISGQASAGSGTSEEARELNNKILKQAGVVGGAEQEAKTAQANEKDKKDKALEEAKKATAAAKKKEAEEKAKLAELQRQLRAVRANAARTSASGQAAANIGAITGKRITGSPDSVARIHKAFINDTRPEALIVACVIALDRPLSNPTMLQQGCLNLFATGTYYQRHKVLVRGKIYEIHRRVERIRATRLLRNHRIHLEAMAKIEQRSIVSGAVKAFSKNCITPAKGAEKNCELLKKAINKLVGS